MNHRDLHPKPPVVFLSGPPGVGKSTLGVQACKELGLKFLNLSMAGGCVPGADTQRQALEAAIENRAADVVALSWVLQQTKGIFKLAQRSGEVLLLWAHPEDMQARSGRQEPLFTPDNPGDTDGGFGERGTGCPEYRRLRRAADETATLVDMGFEEAVAEVKTWIQITIEEHQYSTDVIDGIHTWAVDWQVKFGADKKAARMTTCAMASYASDLRRDGAPESELASVYLDLRAAGTLVFEHDAPEGFGDDVLERFKEAPRVEEFRQRFGDSDKAVERYRRTIEELWRHVVKIRLVGR